VRDPLKGWARKDGALAGTFGLQYAPVGGAGFGLEFVQDLGGYSMDRSMRLRIEHYLEGRAGPYLG
jgi:hypothetical protein